MATTRPRIPLLFSLLTISTLAGAADNTSYNEMLAYLTNSRIDDKALNGSSGAIAVNIAAGDFNQQANLRAFAVGQIGSVRITARQGQGGNTANAPDVATASIGGQALGNASGLISINQASGTANAQLNTASAVLAQQGTSQTSTDQWLADVCACRQETTSTGTGQPGSGTRMRTAAVEAEALRGAQGVVQLNQIAGSNNVTANHLLLDVAVTPR